MILYRENDNLLEGLGLFTIDADGQQVYLDDTATVEVTLLDEDEEEVVGETWPLELTYRSGTKGDFAGVLRNELEVSTGQHLTARIEVDNGPDQHGTITRPVVVQTREE